MTDLDIGGHAIADLVDAFFESVRSVPEIANQEARHAELAHELDQVVSTYLEEHQLSSASYQHIQQDLLNTLAHDLVDQVDFPGDSNVRFDADGNADPAAVMAAMDHHFDALFSSDIFGDNGSAALS